MKRAVLFVLLLGGMMTMKAQNEQTLYLPYDATSLTDEQKESNPVYAAYPLAIQDKIPAAKCHIPVKGLGPFSVSADRKVVFSVGNLQFNAATGTHLCSDGRERQGTWRFAEHQWNYVGYAATGNVYEGEVKSDNTQISSTYNGWIDLFGWGTSGWKSGANAYLPFMTNESYLDYYPGNSYTNDLTGEYARADWGVFNQIGEYPPQIWRTLSKDEWLYIFHGRPNAESLFGLGTVNGVNGIILLPDDWVLPVGIVFHPGPTKGLQWSVNHYSNTHSDNYTHNTYTDSEWQKMQNNGAVFLPAAGYRHGTTISLPSFSGYYWSVSYSNRENIYFLFFDETNLYPTEYNWRQFARSVRLVHDL